MVAIAFYSDDASGPRCAWLTALGLSRLGGRAAVALPIGFAEAATRDALPDGIAVVRVPEAAGAADVGRALATARGLADDTVAALPLDRVRDLAARGLFDAVVTVGAGHASGARALRAARYEAARPAAAPGPVPPWVLVGSDQPILWTQARLSAPSGPDLPFATRTLPTTLPRAAHAGSGVRAAGDLEADALGTGVLLAALALAVAADPFATRLEAADLTALMLARGRPEERGLSDRLVGLAEAYGRLAGGARRGNAPTERRPADRSRDRRPVAAGAATSAGDGAPRSAWRARRA